MNPWLAKKKNKCDYRPLSKKEEIIIDPETIKGRGGSKRDLAVCTGSNCDDRDEVVEHRKKKYYKKGRLVRTKDIQYEPVGININDPKFRERLKQLDAPTTIVNIRFYVTSFQKAPSTVLKALGNPATERSWKKGEPRREGLTIKHRENGFVFKADPSDDPFEDRVLSFLKEIHPHADQLNEVCGNSVVTELSIAAHVVGDDVPSIHLPREALSMLSDLGAEVDVDLYFFPVEA